MIVTTCDKFWKELKIDSAFDVYKNYDAIEIGALVGGATTVFAKNFKRVFVIDPWDGRQQGNDNVYSKWLTATESYSNIQHCRTGSETDIARNFIKNISDLNLGFVFIDGLHTEAGVMNDFELVLPYCNKNTIILLDDMDYHPVLSGSVAVLQKYRSKISILENYAYVNEQGKVGPISKTTYSMIQ